MTGPAYWEDQYQQTRRRNIAQYQPYLMADNAVQQRGTMPAGTTLHPALQSLTAQAGNPPADLVSQAFQGNAELLGRAKFWGIPEQVAAAMPQDHLEAIIQQQEQTSQKAQSDANSWTQLLTLPAAAVSMAGLGAAEAILDAPRNLPIIGEYFRKDENLNKARGTLAYLEEGVRSSTRSDFQWVNSVQKGEGSLAAMWYPGDAAWQAAGIAGKLPGLFALNSPIARLAAQGGAAAFLLEGGSDHPYAAIAGGVALGAAMHPIEQVLSAYGPSIAGAIDRVTKYFDGSWSRFVKPMMGPEEAVAQTLAKAQEVGANPQVTDMAAQSRKTQLQQMANDPAADPATRQQAQEMLRFMGEPASPTYSDAPMQGPLRMNISMEPDPSAMFQNSDMPAAGLSPMDLFAASANMEQNTGRALGLIQGEGVSAADLAEARSAFRAKNGMNVAEANQAAGQMTKQSIIIDSPLLGEAAGQTMPNDGTVARAAMASNPGGVAVIPAVISPADFMHAVGMNPESMPNVRFARRAGSTQLDAVLSAEPITDHMLSQYEQYGVFNGQAATTAAGRSVIVQDITNGLATVKPEYGGAPHYVPVSDLMPSALTSVSRPVPGLYEELGSYVTQRVAATADAMGGAMDTSLLGRMRNENMPGYIEDFLDKMNVTEKAERVRVRQYFNERIVEDYSNAVPEEAAFQNHMEQQATAAEHMVDETPLRRLDAMGQTKGFMVVPNGADGTYKLLDQTVSPVGTTRPPTSISFGSEEAAQEWLSKVNRPAPDVTPPVDVPIEVARALPRQSHMEPSLDNARLHEATSASADDIAETVARTDPGLGDHLRQVIAEAKRSGRLHNIAQAWEYGLGQFQPMRSRWAEISSRLADVGMGDLRPWDDWDTLTTQLSKKHNWENPWMDRWARITDHFDAAQLRTGQVTQMYEIEDDALRQSKALEAGFSPRQINALDEMHQFFREIFPQTGLDPAREIARYISHVKARQSMGASVTNAFEGSSMSPAVQPFYEMVRSGNMQLRELDARNLGNIYVRSLGFEKYMRESWDAATTKWNGVAQIDELKPLANTFINWANLMKTGYVPGNDMVLDTAHSVMNFMMPGISKQQVAKIFNQGMSTTHLALLGFRPDVMARDSIQLFLALPRAGTELLNVMRDIARGSREDLQAMTQRGLDAGTVILGKPRIASPGTFEPTMAGVTATSGTEGVMQPGMNGMQLVQQQGPQGGLYKVLQATTDALHDFIPDGLRHLEGSKLHPLYFYTKQSEMMRLVVGEAGIRRAEKALTTFRAGGTEASFDQLMGDSMARTFDPVVQQKFKDLVASGNDPEAANFMGRQLADATMFRYGMVENPEIARSTFGRIGMQMGNFSTQFYQFSKESLKNGHWSDKAKFLSLMGGVSYGLHAASKLTGWDFSKWQYYNSLTFTGGPWISNIMDAQNLASNVSRMAQRSDQPGGQYLADEATQSATGLGQGLASMLNPLGGGMRTISGMAQAAQSPDPLNAFGRGFVNGQWGNSLDYQNLESAVWGRPEPIQMPQAQPYSSPVSGSRMGTPVPPPAPAQGYHPPQGQVNGYDADLWQQYMRTINGAPPQQGAPPPTAGSGAQF